MKKILLSLFLISLSLLSLSQMRLRIRPDMIIDEKAYPQASPFRMFDEQANIITEPPVGKPVTTWADYIDKDLFYPLTAIIDLGKVLKVTNLYIYDVGGVSNLSFYAQTTAGWELLFTDPLTGYESWNKHVINKSIRYIRVISSAPDGSFPEVVMYGDQATLPPVYPAPHVQIYPNMEDFAGINILHVNDINYATVVKNIRQFHNWAWNEANTDIAGYPGYPNNQYGFNPAPGTFWDFDKVYKDYKDKAMRITPVLQGSPFWMLKSTTADLDAKPVTGTENPESPASYLEHADYLYQFAARYGKTVVPSAKIKLRSDNTVKTALGSVECVENWNEPNKTWKERKGLFMPFEFAAMTSADYDGHQGTLGTSVGLKNADPDLTFVMAGLTGMDTVYLKSMLFWFKQNRTDFRNPFNVINFHHYSNNAGGQIGNPTHGVSPEDDKLEKKVSDMVGFCHRNLINKPIWISEFGYDVSQATSQKAKTYSTFLGADVQAMWLVRSYMAINAGGADRAYAFWLEDDNSNKDSTNLFGTCGLLSHAPPANPSPRKSWYWLSAMNKTLGKYHFDSKVLDGKTYIYKFSTSLSADSSIYCIWNGTSDGTVKINYQLTVNSLKATLVAPQVGVVGGTKTPLVITNGKVTVNVTESPIYVKVYGTSVPLAINNDPKYIAEQTEIFPNPSNGISYLSLPQNTKADEIRLYDAKGNLLRYVPLKHPSSVAEINTSSLNDGIYTIKITGEGFQSIVKKLAVVK